MGLSVAPRGLVLALDGSRRDEPLVILVDGAGEPIPSVGVGSSSAPLVAAVRHALDTFRDQIRAVLVVAGPGSYIGVRSGLAAGLGVAQALGCPLALTSSLEVIANQAEASGETVLALADAGRGGTFGQVMGQSPGGKPRLWCRAGPAQLLARDLPWPAPWAALSATVGSPGSSGLLPEDATVLPQVRDRSRALARIAHSSPRPVPGYDQVTAEYAVPVGAR